MTVEYDHLWRGANKTRDSLLGGGTVGATATTPAFSIGDFTDLSFEQHRGWALRASASYNVSQSWSIEPYYVRWRVSDSPESSRSVADTVNAITARQTFNAYEPLKLHERVRGEGRVAFRRAVGAKETGERIAPDLTMIA